MTATNDLLTRVRRRLALRSALEDGQVGLAAGAGAALALLAARRFLLPEMDAAWPLLGGVVAAAVVPLAGWVVRRRKAHELAAAADEALGLRERVSTSLWLAGAPQGSLDPLVAEDADRAAARVRGADLSRAFRPALRRAPLATAAVFAAALGGLALWQPAAGAVETDEARTRRLADESRVAEVARKLETEARKIEQCAIDRKMPQLATEAAVIKRAAEQMKREPPPPEQALQQLSTLLDAQRDAIRKRGDLKPTDDPRAVLEQEKQLAELLRQMAEAKAESVQQDLDDLVKRLAKDPKSDGAPTGDDLRELANRMDALRKAAKAAEEAGMDAAGLKKKLRDLGNEDLLEKIAEQLREMAAKLDDRNYQDLEQAAEDLPDLADMSREELEKLLKDLKEMAESGDLQKMLEGAKGEMSGGKRFRPGAPGGG